MSASVRIGPFRVGTGGLGASAGPLSVGARWPRAPRFSGGSSGPATRGPYLNLNPQHLAEVRRLVPEFDVYSSSEIADMTQTVYQALVNNDWPGAWQSIGERMVAVMGYADHPISEDAVWTYLAITHGMVIPRHLWRQVKDTRAMTAVLRRKGVEVAW